MAKIIEIDIIITGHLQSVHRIKKLKSESSQIGPYFVSQLAYQWGQSHLLQE